MGFDALKTARGGAVWALGLILLALSACGGGSGNGDAPVAEVKANTAAPSKTLPTPEQTRALLKKGAALSSAELASSAAEAASQKAGQLATKTGSQAATTKAAASASLVTVYRFFNSQTKAHFYTASETEKATVLATLPQFNLDGAAFYASSAPVTGLSPVYRFYNSQTGVHFYTISEDEKALLLANLPQFHLDGVAYYASKVAGNQFIPLYRLYQATKGFHFYTNSAGERDTVVNTLPQNQYEGIGYYVINTLKLPHTGVTDQQCHQAGIGPLVACSSGGATALNSEQDGHRTAINPMSYSEVPKASGGNYARTECVQDDVTGLMWEGKTASGLRAGNNTFTNYDNVAQAQVGVVAPLTNPTQAEIDAASNSVGYKNYVNSTALCGHTDWRLPTPQELHNIMDYGKAGSAAKIKAAWFPNLPATASKQFWTSAPALSLPNEAWYVDFGFGTVDQIYRMQPYYLRLVRDID